MESRDRAEPGSAPDGSPQAPEERVAVNEATFRSINEALEQGRVSRDGVVPFVCECAALGCSQLLHVSLARYEEVRSDPRRFLLAPGHETRFDAVIERHAQYVVVAKQGAAAAIARSTDPRRDGAMG